MSIFQKNRSLFSKTKNTRKKLFPMMMISMTLALCIPVYNYAQPSETVEETEEGLIFKKDIYHQHVGSSSGGGCYSIQRTETEEVEVPCGGTIVYWPDLGTSSCSRCAASYHGDQSGRDCWHSDVEERSYTYYDLGCGKDASTRVGSLTVKQSTTEWTRSLTLTASYQNTSGMKVSNKPYIWNGAAAVEEPVYVVENSGKYTLRLNADACSNTSAATITVNVRNVDVTAPLIKTHTQTPASEWTKDGVLVAITECVDLQPDGSEGCGLHEEPYSYDEGETWTSEDSHLYLENGVHTILVRDKLENTSSYEVEFYNVDVTPPTLVGLEYDHTKNVPSVEFVVTVEDLQPDGSEGCGLHEEAYSYDGGKTWTAENTCRIRKNGVVKIAIRDNLENVFSIEEKVANIDCTGPNVSYTMISRSWTNQDVNLYLSAEDLNEDGSQGIGMDEAWYSLDGGNTWSGETHLVFEDNTEFTILARDKNNNYTKTPIRIIQIDRVQPWVSLSMQVTGEGKDMQVILHASAEDDYSGIPEEAFSWDKGASYTAQSSMTVTENGTYYVYARDKAGNSHFAGIEVDAFQSLLPKLPLTPHKTLESETEDEWETTETEVEIEERIDQPEPETIHLAEGGSAQRTNTLDRMILLLLVLLLLLALFGFLLWLYSRTLAVYGKDREGKERYLGRCWISYKDKYCVKISQTMVNKAETFRFCFRPSALFADAHEGEEIHFLFPEEVCITLTIERKMEMG